MITRAGTKVILSILLAAFATGMASVVPAFQPFPHTYYVAATGDDAWTGMLDVPNGGNTDGPWRTIQHAVNNTIAGDTIFVRAGTYHELVQITASTSGDSGAPKTLIAYVGEQPILDGAFYPDPSSWTNDSGEVYRTAIPAAEFSAAGGPGLVWQNDDFLDHSADRLSMTTEGTWWYDTGSETLYVWARGGGNPSAYTIAVQADRNGFLLDAASWIVLDGLQIVHHMRGIEQLEAAGGSTVMEGLTVRNCTIEHAGQGIVLAGGERGDYGYVNGGVIEENVISDTQSDGIWIGSGTGNIVSRNWIDGTGSNAVAVMGAEATRVENNIIVDTAVSGILVDTEDGLADGTQIINNTIYNSADRGIAIDIGPANPDPDAFPQNTVIWNNIFDGTGSVAIYNQGVNTISNYNLFHPAPGSVANWNGNPYPTLAALRTGTGQEAEGVEGNPMFVVAGTNFHLISSSPAIDAGSNTGAPANDFYGVLRPLDGNTDSFADADIGAAEYDQAPTVTPSQTVPASQTVTASLTPTFTDSLTPTVSPTSTETLTATITDTPSASPSGTASSTLTTSPSTTSSSTATPSFTVSATGSITPTATRTPTVTRTLTPTGPTATLTQTPSRTPTQTATRTITRTRSRTRTRTLLLYTATRSATPTSTVTGTYSPTLSPTITLTPTVTGTATPDLSFTGTVSPDKSDLIYVTEIAASFTPTPTSSSGSGLLPAWLNDSRLIICGSVILIVGALLVLLLSTLFRSLDRKDK